MTVPQEPKKGVSSVVVALFALPILCCAGPVLLAALGAGSVGALLGGVTGSVVVAAVGLAVICVSAAVITRRRRR